MQRDLSEELRRIYNCSPDELLLHTARYERLLTLYRSRFSGQNPVFIVRAPGRVNLVGEHTDYNGYPVLPMAIDRDVVFILGPRTDNTIEIINESPSFERRTFDARFPVAPYDQGDWGNYIKAAAHGILEAGWIDPKMAVGFQAVVGGTIPESAGLSSSSALVVASAIAFLAANGKEIKREPLAELLARAERYVGSEGGGNGPGCFPARGNRESTQDRFLSVANATNNLTRTSFLRRLQQSDPCAKEREYPLCL